MKLIIVRHGETEGNAQELTQGQTHGKLNETGIMQAKKAAEFLKNEKIDFTYTSDLDRARRTAEIIEKLHPETKLILTKELRERSYGIFDGQHESKLKEAFQKSGCTNHEFKPEHGESKVETQKRGAEFFEKLLKLHKGKTVLVVSHGTFLTCLLLHIFGKSFDEQNSYRPGNTAITILDIGDKGHKVRLLNSVKHLE